MLHHSNFQLFVQSSQPVFTTAILMAAILPTSYRQNWLHICITYILLTWDKLPVCSSTLEKHSLLTFTIYLQIYGYVFRLPSLYRCLKAINKKYSSGNEACGLQEKTLKIKQHVRVILETKYLKMHITTFLLSSKHENVKFSIFSSNLGTRSQTLNMFMKHIYLVYKSMAFFPTYPSIIDVTRRRTHLTNLSVSWFTKSNISCQFCATLPDLKRKQKLLVGPI